MQVDVDALEHGLMIGCVEIEGVSDGRNDETRVMNGSQGDESHAIGEIGEKFRCHLYGKARLADAPMPMRVNRRISGRRSKTHTLAVSHSRPINGVSWRGKLR